MERVNLLPWREKLYAHRRREVLWGSLGMLLLFTLIVLVRFKEYRHQEANWGLEVVQIQQQAKVLHQRESHLKHQVEVVKALLAQQEAWHQQQIQGQQCHRLLLSIQQVIPESVWLTELILEGQTLLLQGGGMKVADIEAFAEALRRYSATSKINRVVEAQQEGWHFSLQIPWSEEGDYDA